MRRVLLIAGVLVDLLGLMWILQGVNVWTDSRMSGDPFWAGAGIVAVAVGGVLLIAGARSKRVSAS
jgi:hypothetical protein